MVTPDFGAILPSLLPEALPAFVGPLASRTLGLDRIAKTYEALQAMDASRPIAERLLAHLDVSYRLPEGDLERIPERGPAVIVANHPFGILEGAVLAVLLLQRRPDVRFLANGILTMIPEVRDLVIPVDPIGGSAAAGNRAGMRRALEHLERGGMLVTFPAGEVSHFQWRERESVDPPWNPAIARLVAIAARRGCAANVVPVYVAGANSLLFQAAGVIHPRLRTALLARELLNKRGVTVDLWVGKPVESGRLLAIPSAPGRTAYLRWRTYLLAHRGGFKQNTRRHLRGRTARARREEPVAEAAAPALVAGEVARLGPECLLAESGDLRAYLTPAARIPTVTREIGRLREMTFRGAGEGTGRPLDLDRFDRHYLHLFVWNAAKQEVVGAYRLTGTDHAGLDGLYTATLFRFGEEFLRAMGPALELGRSFVRPEYQKAFAPLLLLWKGIGKYVARNPRYRVLFGPVSISNQYQAASRELMVAFLERRASLRDWLSLVRARHAPPKPRLNVYCTGVDELSELVSELEPNRAGVPVLLRQYLKLGGKLLGFNVDPEFSNALDGLIVVDLARTEPKLLERYLGKPEAAGFLAYQKGLHGTLETVSDR